MFSFENILIFYTPIVLSVLLAFLRHKHKSYWYGAFCATLIILTTLLVITQDLPLSHVQTWTSVFLLILLPLSVVFAVLQIYTFHHRPALIIIAGPIVYWFTILCIMKLLPFLGIIEPYYLTE